MRDGEKVELSRDGLERRKIIELMVGRSMDQEFPEEERKSVEALTSKRLDPGKKVRDVSLK